MLMDLDFDEWSEIILALAMRANYIETRDVKLSANDLAERKKPARHLIPDQVEMIQYLRKLKEKIRASRWTRVVTPNGFRTIPVIQPKDRLSPGAQISKNEIIKNGRVVRRVRGSRRKRPKKSTPGE